MPQPQAQTRKQKILGDVKRKRQQRAVISITVAVALVAIIVVAIFLIPHTPDLVPLPDYLSHCVTGALYHSHPFLQISINGGNVPIPLNTVNDGCQQPIHTHSEVGILHIETDQNRNYTLHDWFLLWGHYLNNPTYAIFNSSQIFQYKTDFTHHLTMKVDNVTDSSFDQHVFPRNASPSDGNSGGLCEVPPGQTCVQDNIVITYS